MGRHSAPDDDPDDATPSGAAVAVRDREDVDAPPGRHARPGAERDAPPDAGVINGRPSPARPSPPVRAPADADTDTDLEVGLDELITVDDTGEIAGTDTDTDAGSDVATAHDDTQRIPPVIAVPTARPAPTTAPVSTEPPPGHTGLRGAAQNSAADLHLARSNRRVLAACAAAVVLPFVVEIVVLVVLGTLDGHSVLIWLWAPLVVAGVLLGVTLDIAHRRHAAKRT